MAAVDLAMPTFTASSVVLTVFVATAITFLYKLLSGKSSLPVGAPVLEVDDQKTLIKDDDKGKVFPALTAALKEAFPKFQGAAFLITGRKPLIWADQWIIPPKWVDGLKNLPEDKLSFIDAMEDRFNGQHTLITAKDREQTQVLVRIITVELTRHISKVMDVLDEEIEYAVKKVLPACDDWTEVYPAKVLPEIVALVSGRIFVGLPLCRDPDFIRSTIMFTIDSFLAGTELNKYPKFLLPYIARFTKKIGICKQQHVTMMRLLKPELEQRMAMVERGEELPVDLMTWIINNAKPEHKFNLASHAQAQLAISLAAIHTTTMTAGNAWFDLAAHPECVKPLRDEWEEVLSTESNGIISKASMPKLKKLDSFIKESQRINPLGPITFDRKVNSPITLPDGTQLPKGTYIGVAAQEIGHDEQIWGNAEEFDGFRFEKLRQQPGKESSYQFATTGMESMYFGHGKHACPGRFFAANEIKLILAHLVRNYEIKYPEGQSRPANIVTPSGTAPDHTKATLLKKRKL